MEIPGEIITSLMFFGCAQLFLYRISSSEEVPTLVISKDDRANSAEPITAPFVLLEDVFIKLLEKSPPTGEKGQIIPIEILPPIKDNTLTHKVRINQPEIADVSSNEKNDIAKTSQMSDQSKSPESNIGSASPENGLKSFMERLYPDLPYFGLNQEQSQGVQTNFQTEHNFIFQFANGTNLTALTIKLQEDENSKNTTLIAAPGEEIPKGDDTKCTSSSDPACQTETEPDIDQENPNPSISEESMALPTNTNIPNQNTKEEPATTHPSEEGNQCNRITDEKVVKFFNPKFPMPENHCKVCFTKIKILPNVCQVRVDINVMELAPPSKGVCNHQYLSVQGTIRTPGVSKICGINGDIHFYFDIAPDETAPVVELVVICNDYSPHRWGIWLTQIDCSQPLVHKAPSGCFQYFWEPEGIIESLSLANNQYYNDQHYRICILAPKDSCKLALQAKEGDFMIERFGVDNVKTFHNSSGLSSVYCPRDFLLILMGSAEGDVAVYSHDRFCGGTFAFQHGVTVPAQVLSPIYTPYAFIEFHTGTPEIFIEECHRGFRMSYSFVKCVSKNANFRANDADLLRDYNSSEEAALQPPSFLKKISGIFL